ncbi:MAG: heme exporter protein CcmD [Alphaproteobacteria bacterium]|nr:heme exporter protein CcmD [Alphaproteobacteria bacterium]
MQMLSAWLAMGGYAVYVWPAYGIAAVVLGGVMVSSWQRHRESVRTLARLQRQFGSRE